MSGNARHGQRETRAPLNPHLSSLIELQTLDLRIAEIREQRRKIPERLAAAEAPLRDAARLLKETTDSVEALVKERRARERDLEVHEMQTEKLKARLSELKTNKEYQAYLFEIEMANKKKGEIEEQILILMEKIEQTQRTAKDAQAKVTEAERAFGREKKTLEELETKLEAELSELDRKQRELAAAIDKGLFDRYTKLKATRKDVALAPVRDGICQGCRLQVPPQLVAEVKRSDELQTCPYCHRMLYWDGGPVEDVKIGPSAEKADDEVGETV